jgi:Holliday junction resolvase
MPNKNYLRGVATERKAKAELEKEGYLVLRMSGSHGLFDLVAINDKFVRCIQLKRVKEGRRSFQKEIDEIQAFQNHPKMAYRTEPHHKPTFDDMLFKKELWVWYDAPYGRRGGRWEKLGMS